MTTFAPALGDSRGFTVIELVIVMMILAILTVVAAPGLRTLLLNQQVKTASHSLLVSIATARSEAVTRNADVVVRPSGSWTTGWTVATAGGSELRRDYGSARLAIVGPAQITFRGDGRPTADRIEFSIAANGASSVEPRCLRLHLNGRPYLKGGAC
ncbi:MAG TPA: GspH/FimT family pseudopilin [Burkholderiales bacterium]|nr:GspH/FimT family pseudopilin [Burkholderiales bacterium]